MTMTPDAVAACFTRPDAEYDFARWGRPIVPVVFGVDDATLSVVKGAIEAVVTLANHKMAETDPELGANVMVFFVRDWDELLAVPDLGRMIDGLPALVERLNDRNAHQYRTFRFDDAGAIKACFCFCRIDGAIADLPAETIALSLAAQVILRWGEQASLLVQARGNAVLRPEIAAVIRAAYDPNMPMAAKDRSHALRLAARAGIFMEAEQ